MTTDPTTLSLADLAAAVVRLGAHDWYCRDDLDLLLAAANRLPGVVAEGERLRLAVAELRAVLEAVQNLDENDGIARGKLYREDAPTLFETKDDGFGALYLGHAIERVMRKTKETP